MFGVSSIDLASIVVALIAGLVALSTARTSSKASKLNVETTSRVDMEKEAYQRARAFDTDTIERQDREIEELRAELSAMRRENAEKLAAMQQSHERELDEVKRRLRRVEWENMEMKKLIPVDQHPQLDHGEGDN